MNNQHIEENYEIIKNYGITLNTHIHTNEQSIITLEGIWAGCCGLWGRTLVPHRKQNKTKQKPTSNFREVHKIN